MDLLLNGDTGGGDLRLMLKLWLIGWWEVLVLTLFILCSFRTAGISWRRCLELSFREANQCADFLAKKGATQKQDFRIYDDLPVNISILLYYDSISMYFERLCLNSNF